MLPQDNKSTKTFQSGLSLRQSHLDIIRGILDREFPLPGCKAYLFGSRAEEREQSASDVDLAIRSREDATHRIARARSAFEESGLPYTVDLVDLDKASASLQREIEEKGRLIWER